jgi:hypothetical protein
VNEISVITITDLLDSSTTKERFLHLVHLEEDLFVIGFDKQVQKAREKAWHDRHIKQKRFQVGNLVLLYKNKFMQHLGKFRMKSLVPYVIKNVTYETVA